MQIYLVHLKASPTSNSEEFGVVGGAYVHSFVTAESLSDAATKAVEYVMGRLWVITEQTTALLMTDDRIDNLDESDLAAFSRAHSDGMCSYFVAWPLEDRADDTVELRSLRDSDKTHKTSQ